MKLSEHTDWENDKLNVVKETIDELQIPYIVNCDDRYNEFIFRSDDEELDFITNISFNIIGKTTEETLEDTIDSKMRDIYKNFKNED